MSDETAAELEAIDEQLERINVTLKFLLHLLPQEDLEELNKKLKEIKDAAWERRMGEDL